VEVRPGLEVALVMGTVGRRLSVGIAERIGIPELASNVPVMILCELERRGPLRPRDLLEATGLTSGGLTKQLDHLEALGQIERSFGTLPDDRRASVVSLTPAGSTTAISIAEAIEAQLDDLRTFARTMVDLTRA
jgi:DNA-binding HxlR family transcriptional regulator